MSYQKWDKNNLPKDAFEIYKNSVQIRFDQNWKTIRFSEDKKENISKFQNPSAVIKIKNKNKTENFSYEECYSTRAELIYLTQVLGLQFPGLTRNVQSGQGKNSKFVNVINDTGKFAETLIKEIFKAEGFTNSSGTNELFLDGAETKKSIHKVEISPIAQEIFVKNDEGSFEPDGYCNAFGGFYIESKMQGFAASGTANEKLLTIVEKALHYNNKPLLIIFSGEHETEQEPFANMYFAGCGLLGNTEQERINNQKSYTQNTHCCKTYEELSKNNMLYVCKLSKLPDFLKKCKQNGKILQDYAL